MRKLFKFSLHKGIENLNSFLTRWIQKRIVAAATIWGNTVYRVLNSIRTLQIYLFHSVICLYLCIRFFRSRWRLGWALRKHWRNLEERFENHFKIFSNKLGFEQDNCKTNWSFSCPWWIRDIDNDLFGWKNEPICIHEKRYKNYVTCNLYSNVFVRGHSITTWIRWGGGRGEKMSVFCPRSFWMTHKYSIVYLMKHFNLSRYT